VSHSLRLDVPDEVYEPLRRQADACGRQPEQLAVQWLRGQAVALGLTAGEPTDQAWGGLLSFAGQASLGHPSGADNAGIDTDLATGD